jgi:CheY-like chemotaxis protein
MKLEPTFPVEDYRALIPILPSRRAASHCTARDSKCWKHTHTMKPKVLARLRRNEDDSVASFDVDDLIRHRDHRWELLDGSATDHAATHERCAHSEHGALIPSEPLPATAQQAGSAQALQNRILIADDDALVRGSLAAVLESEGFVVDEAENGIEAVTRAISHRPDLILLDLNMPHWDGWTAFNQLDRVTPLVPVIVITARPNQYQQAVQLGVDAFMEKPLNIPILMRAIKRLTNEVEDRYVRRIIRRTFVTELLGGTDA